MILGKVIRSIWATQKEASLTGHRLVIVSPVSKDGVEGNEMIVAVDQFGAGSGDLVLVVQGEPASRYFKDKAPIDAVVVALVDLSQGESPQR
jgi:ethanolamine utilization protein EutN